MADGHVNVGGKLTNVSIGWTPALLNCINDIARAEGKPFARVVRELCADAVVARSLK